MTTKRQGAYGYWDSVLTAEKVCRDSNDINFVRSASDGVYFVNSEAGEKDKLAVWHLSDMGVLSRISANEINVRSRVHEYGGLPYVVHENHLYVCNLVDQLIYKQPLRGNAQEPVAEPIPLTQIESDQIGNFRYADFLVDVHRQRLICVREDHRLVDDNDFDASEVVNTLVAIDLESGGEGEILFEGSDFVSTPRLSPDGKTLAWQTWSHPNMPWDNTEIRLANFDSKGKLTNIRQVQQQSNGSLVQPQFDNKGQLYFIADWSDWWNLYRVTAEELEASCEPEPVCSVMADFAPAAWVLGASNYALLGDDSIVVSLTRNGRWELGIIEASAAGKSNLLIIEDGYGQLENLVTIDRQVYFTAATPVTPNSIHSLAVAKPLKINSLAIRKMSITEEPSIDRGMISQAEIICFNTADQRIAYGNFYPPANTAFTGNENDQPPLLVSIHGGPTSAAKVSLNLKVQYWTSRGFAVFDVNHRGSTGYGREFRRSLYLKWGVVDLEDIIFGVQHLISEGLVDPAKIAIHGGSAGGYAVMAALSACDLFAAGTSYYGVSDLEVLAQGTHKFESRYLDQLIGPYPEAQQTYRDRSPIYNIDKISAPLLLLQGLEDKVVPPEQAERICNKLKQKGVDVRYMAFAGEGHGFRRLENQVQALLTELEFYQETLGLSDGNAAVT